MNTTYFLDLVAGNVFGSKKSPALPATYFIGLSTTAPSADGTNVTEPDSSVGYAREEITNLTEPEGGIVKNQHPITFSESSGSWGTITHYGVFDQKENGNLLMYGEVDPPRVVDVGTTMTIKDGVLQLFVQDAV